MIKCKTYCIKNSMELVRKLIGIVFQVKVDYMYIQYSKGFVNIAFSIYFRNRVIEYDFFLYEKDCVLCYDYYKEI